MPRPPTRIAITAAVRIIAIPPRGLTAVAIAAASAAIAVALAAIAIAGLALVPIAAAIIALGAPLAAAFGLGALGVLLGVRVALLGALRLGALVALVAIAALVAVAALVALIAALVAVAALVALIAAAIAAADPGCVARLAGYAARRARRWCIRIRIRLAARSICSAGLPPRVAADVERRLRGAPAASGLAPHRLP